MQYNNNFFFFSKSIYLPISLQFYGLQSYDESNFKFK